MRENNPHIKRENWRNKKTENKRELTWKLVEENVWGCKISETNYIFVDIRPLIYGSYYLKYMDAELKDFTSQEKEHVRIKYNIRPYAKRALARQLMEHHGFFEWIEVFETKQELADYLEGYTSFPLTLLKNLVEVSADFEY